MGRFSGDLFQFNYKRFTLKGEIIDYSEEEKVFRAALIEKYE